MLGLCTVPLRRYKGWGGGTTGRMNDEEGMGEEKPVLKATR